MRKKTDEMTISTQQNPPFLHQFPSYYIVKNAKTDDTNTSNALNTYVIIVTNKCQCTGCLIVQNVEASDFNHSGGYCYKLFFSSLHVYTMLLLTIFHFLLTCVSLMFTLLLYHVLHVFTSRPTHFLHIFKPVVRQLYSLAFH